jgi:hypothetical protein
MNPSALQQTSHFVAISSMCSRREDEVEDITVYLVVIVGEILKQLTPMNGPSKSQCNTQATLR